MKKFSALIMALLIFAMGFTGVLAVEGAPEGTALTSESYTGIDNENNVKESAKIVQKTQERVRELQEARIQAQHNYASIKEETSNVRTEMLRKRSQLNDCDSEDNAECQQLRSEVRALAGDYLYNLADMLIKHLEQVQIKVKLSEEITEDEEIKLIDIIETRKGRLESVKEEIENLKSSDASISEDRNKIVEKLKTEVRDAKAFLGKISIHVQARQIKILLAQQEQAGDKIERILTEMEDEDEVYNDVNELLEEFNTDLEEAKKYLELAMENPEQDITSTIEQEAETRDYLIRARNEIKGSYVTLHKIVRRIRETNREITQESGPSELSEDGSELEDDSELEDSEDSELADNEINN